MALHSLIEADDGEARFPFALHAHGKTFLMPEQDDARLEFFMSHRLRLAVMLLATGTAAYGLIMILGGRPSWAASDDAMQAVADATVIDAECRTTNTIFGLVFRYGEEHGIQTVDIMPLGRRRKEFEAAFHRRLTTTPHEEICGSLQAHYSQKFPDWFQAR